MRWLSFLCEALVQATKPKPFCFVLMPFDAGFTDIYQFGIKGACEDADIYCERVDEQIFLGSMLDRIYNQISKADILVADMTGRNPNVFYEVGYAHALGKNVILLTQNAEDIPFDLKHFPHIVYDKTISKLRPELAKRLEHIILQNSRQEEISIALDLYLGNTPITNGDITHLYHRQHRPQVKFILANNSTRTYNPGDFRIGAIVPKEFVSGVDSHVIITKLPDGRNLHMLPKFDTLFPGAFTSVSFLFASHEKDYQDPCYGNYSHIH
jgi:hypothetical protein